MVFSRWYFYIVKEGEMEGGSEGVGKCVGECVSA